MKMHLKMSSAKWQPFCPGEDQLIQYAKYWDSLVSDMQPYISRNIPTFSAFVVFWCGLVVLDFTYIIQGCFTGLGQSYDSLYVSSVTLENMV